MSKRIGIVFPGQGSQKVGMGSDLFESKIGREYFNKADEILGRPLSDICFNGPEDILKDTRNAQAGLYVVSAILFEHIKAAGINVDYVAGHSLGELTAYFAADVYNFETGLGIIQARGDAMAASYSRDDSAMAAIMKLDLDTINSVLKTISGVVVAANLNCPGQIVISGQKQAVLDASTALSAQGGRAIPLPVSGAFHSPLMQKGSEILTEFVKTQSLKDARIPIVLNRLAEAESNAKRLSDNLGLQVVSPVRWIESMEYLNDKVDVIVECGFGKVLTGLVKKILPKKQIITVNTVEDIMELKESIQ